MIDRPAGNRRTLASTSPQTGIYGWSFWIVYLANTSLMVAVSLLFRYGDFVAVLGGGEFALGWIVGVGTIGSLVMRLAQGSAIDRYGPRRIWLASLAGVVVSLLLHLVLDRVDGPAIFLVRIAYNTSLAGAFGASITFISLRAPAARMAEMIGMLGSSGFVGIALGSQLGDLLCRADKLTRWHMDRLFLVAAGLVCVSMVSIAIATHGQVPKPRGRRRPPMLWLLRRYHPGVMLLMAVAMGIGIGLPGTFLRPYTETLGIAQIGTFFGVYSVVAFATRVVTRRVPDRIGIAPTVLLGMGALVASMLLYLVVRSPWELALPGVAAGIGHALLFPAIVAGGSRAFPARYRGLGTTLTLGMFDVGNLIGMPLVGTIVETSRHVGLPAYPTMFVTVASLLTIMSAFYAFSRTAWAKEAPSRAAQESTNDANTLRGRTETWGKLPACRMPKRKTERN